MPIVYGRHPVEEVLAAARENIKRILVDRSDRTDGLAVDTIEVIVDRALLEQQCQGGNHQGIAAELTEFRYADLNEALNIERGCVVVLDQVQDPHNFGAILRSAAALGASAVIIGKDRQVAVTDTVIRTSAGFAYRIPVVQVTNIARTLQTLADANFWSVTLADDAKKPIWELDLTGKIVLVLGGEGPGVRQLVRRSCDFSASIPMVATGDSLNVSVAAGAVLYEWRRQN